MASRRRLALVLARLGLSLLATAVVLLLLELGLRVYSPIELRRDTGRVHLPVNQRWLLTNDHLPRLERTIVHSHNSLGFRGPEPPLRWDATLTLLAVGGSTTQCYYLSDGKTWPDRLLARLESRFRDVWLGNAGLDGTSTYGHRDLMERYVLDLRPDVVLFLFAINDVGRSSPSLWDQRLLPAASRAGSGWLAHSAIYRFLTVLHENVTTIRTGVVHLPLDLGSVGRARPPADPDRLLRSHARFLAGYTSRVEWLLDASLDHGIAPVLITQPVLYGGGRDPRTGVDLGSVGVNGTDGATAWAILERYNDVVRRLGHERGALVIDLADQLPKSSAYFYDWAHFTNEGAEEAARVIEAELAPWLAERFPAHLVAQH